MFIIDFYADVEDAILDMPPKIQARMLKLLERPRTDLECRKVLIGCDDSIGKHSRQCLQSHKNGNGKALMIWRCFCPRWHNYSDVVTLNL